MRIRYLSGTKIASQNRSDHGGRKWAHNHFPLQKSQGFSLRRPQKIASPPAIFGVSLRIAGKSQRPRPQVAAAARFRGRSDHGTLSPLPPFKSGPSQRGGGHNSGGGGKTRKDGPSETILETLRRNCFRGGHLREILGVCEGLYKRNGIGGGGERGGRKLFSVGFLLVSPKAKDPTILKILRS